MSDSNLIDWIESEANGEPVEWVVIGEPERHSLKKADLEKGLVYGEMLSWDEARGYLNYGFYDGFGGPECHPITAWTSSKVIFICEYDGSTRTGSVPRNPSTFTPGYF